ncbi:hypothetical protein V8C35DRAFT_18625 [Trichoderma chlorosporum]
MPPPILHVIYAGYGDALLLECDDALGARQFILVDGGPLMTSYTAWARVAPYHRYLRSAMDDLLGHQNGVTKAIITHPDEDHFGGYMELLRPANVGVPAGLELFIPSDHAADSAAEDVTDALAQAGGVANRDRNYIAQTQQMANDNDKVELFHGVKAIHPVRAEIWYCYNVAAAAAGNLTHNVVNQGRASLLTNRNHRSILMYTRDPANPNNDPGIFFTGDNNADRILNRMAAEFGAGNVPNFAIYKVQHHGSHLDNQLTMNTFQENNAVGRESVVWFLCRVYEADNVNIPELQRDMAREAARHLWRYVTRTLGRNWRDWYNAMKIRIRFIQDQLDNIAHRPPATPIVRLPLAVSPNTTINPANAFKECDDVFGLNNDDSRSRRDWNLIVNDAFREFKEYVEVRGVTAFYNAFRADSYVVSADGTHGHPRSVTLVGLAMALKEQNRAARLYVTSGISINVPTLKEVVSMVNSGTLSQLFCGNWLNICFLRIGTYISLNGDSTVAVPNRDIHQVTERFAPGIFADSRREELDKKVRYQPDQKLLRRVSCQLSFLADPTNNNSRKYLGVRENANNGLTWYIESNWRAFFWVALKDLRQNNQGGYELLSGVGEYSLRSDTIQLAIVPGRAAFRLTIQNQNQSAYYTTAPDGTRTFNVGPNPPLGHTLIEFEMETRLAVLPSPNVWMNAFHPPVQALMSSRMASASLLRRTAVPLAAEATAADLVSSPSMLEATTDLMTSLSVPAAATPTDQPSLSLLDAFEKVGESLEREKPLQLIDVLDLLFRDGPTLEKILDNLPDMLLQAGFAALVVDPAQSTAIVAEKPFMGKIINSASLSCRPDQQQADIKWPVEITVASLIIKLDKLDVLVENCQTSDARMSVRGTASMGKESRTLTLTLTWSSGALDGTAPTVSFSAGTSSIENMIELMSGSDHKSGIMQSDVPFASQSSDGSDRPAPVLQDPKTTKTEVGFSLAQPTASCGQYHLAEVWVETKLSEWIKFLPNPEKFKDLESTARVRILHLFETKYRRVAVCISVDLPVGGRKDSTDPKSDRKVSVEFQANPLSGAGNYDYRLRIFQMSDGTTIPEMADAVGFRGDMADKVFDAVPGMRKVLDTVRLRDLGLSVTKDKAAGWHFAEWWLEMYVPYIEIMPDVIALHCASFRIDCLSDDLMVLKGQAGFRNNKFHKDLVASFKLPNRLGLGYLRFDAPNGLSISDICDIFSLGDVSGIPVVNELATIEVLSFEVKFARPASGIKFVSLTIKLRKSQLQLGQAVKLEDINLSFTWRKIKDAKPADGDVSGGKIDTSQPRQEKSKQRDESLAESTKSVMDFDMSVHLQSIESELSVQYDGQKQALNGVFQSQFQSPLSMAKLLQSAIPGGNSLNMGDQSMKGSSSLMDSFFDPDSAKAITDLLAGIGLRSFKISYDSTRKEVSTFAMQGVMMLGSIDLSLSFTSSSKKIKTQENKIQVQSTWDFWAKLPLTKTTDTKTGSEKMKLGVLLSGLLGDATDQVLPPFITNIEFSQPKNDQELAMKLQKVALDTMPGARDQPSQPPDQGAKYFVFDLTLNVSSFSFTFLQCKRASASSSPAHVNDKTQSATPAAFAKRVMMASLQEIPEVVIPCIGPIKKPVEQILYLWVQDATPSNEKGGAAAKKDGNSDPKMRGLTHGELKAINKVLATKSKPEGNGSKAELLFRRTKDNISDDDVVLEAGHHFMMTGKNAKGEVVVFIDYVFGKKASSKSSQSGDKTDPSPQQPSGSENSEPAAAGAALAPYKKSSGPISISNIGFEWKGSPKDGKLSIILDASLLIGPIGFSLIGFKLSFPITDQTSLRNLPKPEVSIDGLAASFNKPPLLISGAFLHQVVDGNDQYMGAILISYGVYLFQAAGFYGKATAPSGETFTSAFIFCRFNGPLMSVGWAEISGLVAGVGYNSSIEFPSASRVPFFPLITPPETGDPKDSLKAFMGDEGGKMITPRLDSFWVAAGVKVTAFQVLKVDAVLVLSFDPTIKIGIFAMAVADLPPSPKPGPGAFVHVELALAATIDVALGVMKIEGQLTPASYILDRNCHLTGGFAMYSWFDSPDPNLRGDWVFSIGGYHRSFQPPAHYPVPPRLGISWSFSSSISIRGEAYFAITPKMCMGGGRLDLTLRAGPLRAWFNAYADFLIQYQPFHFIAEAGVSVGVECTVDFCIVSVTLRGSLEASLYLEGPPVSGRVSVDFWVATFTIRFGEPPKGQPPSGLKDFFDLALQGGDSPGGSVAGKSDNKAEPHVFSCQAGLVPSGDAETPKEAPWIVRGEGFAFHIACKFVIASCRVITAKAADEKPTPKNSVSRDWGGGDNNEAQTIYSKPMQKKDPLMSTLDVRIYRDSGAAFNTALVADSDSNLQQTSQNGGWCKVQRVIRPMPSALWGKYDERTDPLSPSADQDAMLDPGGGTKQLMTGIDIQAPDAELSSESPIQFNVVEALGEAVFASTSPQAPKFPALKPAAGSWRPDEPSPDWKTDRDIIKKEWESKQDTAEDVLNMWKDLSAFKMWDTSKLSGATPKKTLERFEELYLAMPRLTVVV